MITRKAFEKVGKLFEKIEKQPINFYLWCITFLSIILIRIFCESWIDGFANNSASYIFYNVINTLVFFLLAYLLFLGFLSKLLHTSIVKVANIMLWGYIIIIFPPIIDHIIFGDSKYMNFYGIYELDEMFNRFIAFFGDRPDFGVTYGTRIEIAIVTVLVAIYSFFKTRKWLKSVWAAFLSYAILFILATFPSWLVIIGQGFHKGFINVGELDIVRVFMPPARIFSKEMLSGISATLSFEILVFSINTFFHAFFK